MWLDLTPENVQNVMGAVRIFMQHSVWGPNTKLDQLLKKIIRGFLIDGFKGPLLN